MQLNIEQHKTTICNMTWSCYYTTWSWEYTSLTQHYITFSIQLMLQDYLKPTYAHSISFSIVHCSWGINFMDEFDSCLCGNSYMETLTYVAIISYVAQLQLSHIKPLFDMASPTLLDYYAMIYCYISWDMITYI